MAMTTQIEFSVKVNGERFFFSRDDIRRQHIAIHEQCEGCGRAMDNEDENPGRSISLTALHCGNCGQGYPVRSEVR